MGSRRIHFIDFETHRFGPGNMAPPIVCMSWKTEGDEVGLGLWQQARIRLVIMLKEAIAGEAVIVAHNAEYDMVCVCADDVGLASLVWQAYAVGGIECTKVREKLLDIAEGDFNKGGRRPYALATLVKKYFGYELDKDEVDGYRLRYAELEDIPLSQWPERAVTYAKEDSEYGYDLYVQQEQRAIRIRYGLPTQHLEARAGFALQLTGCWGVTTDADQVQALSDAIGPKMVTLREAMLESGLMRHRRKRDGTDVYSKDMKAVKRELELSWNFALGDIPLTDKGALKTDKDTLEMTDSPDLKELLEFKGLEKISSTYLKRLYEGRFGNTIHPRFNSLVETGRTSCGNPNLQNQPRMPGVRECFISRKGRVLLACDYNSQEMRTLAQSCIDIVGYSRLGEEYQRNPLYDPHQAFADATGGERQHTKIANFGIPGGMGAAGLVRYAKGYGQTWTLEFAQTIKGDYLRQQPEMVDYFKHVGDLTRPNYGTQVIGRSGFKRGGVTYCQAANGFFQSLAAHASKDALFNVLRRCYDDPSSDLYESRPWAFVHDEIILETPEDRGHVAALEIERVMVDTMNEWTPDVPAAAEATLMRFWSKNAKRTFNGDRLVPWEIDS